MALIKKLAQGHISKPYSAIKFGCTLRTVNRLIKKCQLQGKSAFVHGNTGRKPLHTYSEQKVLQIITIYNNKYWDTPRATWKTKKQMKKILKDLHNVAKTQTEKILIETTLISLEDAHSRRPRCSYFGEMIQMDASVHLWFGETKTQLHVAIDDCTSTIVGALRGLMFRLF